MISPHRTHVLSVGIGSYEQMGAEWRLPRAAEHAIAFARWTQQAGVPADHIHLFLSAPERAAHAQEIADAGLTAHAATFTALFDFIDKRLTTWSGDLLYIFWSGHGSLADDGMRVLFYEDVRDNGSVAFDLNDFFVRLRTSSAERFALQLAYVDACANRFEELGFGASLGRVRTAKGRWSHLDLQQRFFVAADTGEQATEGAFGRAVLDALREETAARGWPPAQDDIVARVRTRFDGAPQRPVQLIWIASNGDTVIEQRSGELPGSRSVNAAARMRGLPVKALRRFADIAISYADFGDTGETGAAARAALYARLCAATSRPPQRLARSTPRIEMLHIVGAALQWGAERELAADLGMFAPAAELTLEFSRIPLVNAARAALRTLPATPRQLRDEFRKTMAQRPGDPDRLGVTTPEAMLDELSQFFAADDPDRPLWEFLLRLADLFPNDRGHVDTFLKDTVTDRMLLTTIRGELAKEQRFILSIALHPRHTEERKVDRLEASLIVADTPNIIHRSPPRAVESWDDVAAFVAEAVHAARYKVLQQYRRDEHALLVEFLVPGELLTRVPVSFAIDLAGARVPLDQIHSVVLRLREHEMERDKTMDVAAWEQIAARIDRDAISQVQWMDHTRAKPTVATCNGLVALQFLPQDDVLSIVNIGFPFLAWLRREPAAGDWPGFVRAFEAWARQWPLRHLPRDLRNIRQTPDDLGIHLTMFWDDPGRADHWCLEEVLPGGMS